MPTYLLLEMSDPDADVIQACCGTAVRLVLRATCPTLAGFASALEDAQITDDEDEVAAVARDLANRKAVAAKTYGTPNLRAYPDLRERCPNVARVLDEARAERDRAQPTTPDAVKRVLAMGQPGDLEPLPDPAPPPHPRTGVARCAGKIQYIPPRVPAFPVLPPEAYDVEPDGPGIPADEVFGPLLAQCRPSMFDAVDPDDIMRMGLTDVIPTGPAFHGDPGDEPLTVDDEPGYISSPAKPATTDDDRGDADDDTDTVPFDVAGGES